MQELFITPSTLIILAVIVICAALAVRRLLKRGMCDCHDDACGGCGKKEECSKCQDMAAKMQEIVKSA